MNPGCTSVREEGSLSHGAFTFDTIPVMPNVNRSRKCIPFLLSVVVNYDEFRNREMHGAILRQIINATKENESYFTDGNDIRTKLT